MKKTILVTGGAGYIGSHTCVELLNKGYNVVVVDNLSNSSSESLKRVEEITGEKPVFYETDVLEKKDLQTVFKNHAIHTIIHFAGLKAVGESTEIPLKYYHNNITGTLTLLQLMKEFHVKNIVFSSSATVYGDPATLPITEDFPTTTTNPYGSTKLFIEEILKDLYKSDNSWNIALLRYFNPVGAHPSGKIGEDPNDIPNNLMPYISQVAIGKLKELSVFGNDYSTPDGTGVRDYIHVTDLAKGHIAALAKLDTDPGLIIHNLGTGQGYSVLELVNAFEKITGKKIPYKIVPRRPGDIAACYADPKKAAKELNWKTEFGINEIVRDAWNWQTNNPDGYR
ncbi:MAG: UDP-glucose 4-epimerase GalE [Desulfobacteraceae bacterium]|nr:UDP-glucose 4-epimerase GalE [Desulfobacteraceae bacterium]